MSGGKKALVIAGWIVLVAAGLALVGLVVMLLWNRILSGVLGLLPSGSGRRSVYSYWPRSSWAADRALLSAGCG